MESEQQREERLAKKREYMREYMRNRTDKELKGRSNKAWYINFIHFIFYI